MYKSDNDKEGTAANCPWYLLPPCQGQFQGDQCSLGVREATPEQYLLLVKQSISGTRRSQPKDSIADEVPEVVPRRSNEKSQESDEVHAAGCRHGEGQSRTFTVRIVNPETREDFVRIDRAIRQRLRYIR